MAVAGGDGTVGAAAAALTHTDRVLGILPAGTGNDIADRSASPCPARGAAAAVAGGVEQVVDLGATGAGWFAHAAAVSVSVGFAARVSSVRGWRRPLAYPLAALRAWRIRQPLDVAVVVDGGPMALSGPPVQVTIVNAPRVGGPLGRSVQATPCTTACCT